MQRGVERAMLHLQELIRSSLNVLPDLVTVGGSIKKRPQDEHVERSLEQPDALRRLLRHRRHSTLKLATMVDARLSLVKQAKPRIKFNFRGPCRVSFQSEVTAMTRSKRSMSNRDIDDHQSMIVGPRWLPSGARGSCDEVAQFDHLFPSFHRNRDCSGNWLLPYLNCKHMQR